MVFGIIAKHVYKSENDYCSGDTSVLIFKHLLINYMNSTAVGDTIAVRQVSLVDNQVQ